MTTPDLSPAPSDRHPSDLDARAEAARTAGDRDGLVRALAARAEALALSDPDRARRDAVEARRLARTLNDPALDALASALEVLVAWLDGRPSDLRLPPDDPDMPRPVRLRRALAAAALGGGPPELEPSEGELRTSSTLAAIVHLLRASQARTSTPWQPPPPRDEAAPSARPLTPDTTLEALAAVAVVLAAPAPSATGVLGALLGPPTSEVPMTLDTLAPTEGAEPAWSLTAAGARTLLARRDHPAEVVVFLGPRQLPAEQVPAFLAALSPLLRAPSRPGAETQTQTPDAWLRDAGRLDVELRAGRLSFFPDVRTAFTEHLLTRDVLRGALERALQRHAGVYAQVAADWGIEPYQRWMDFLRRNGALLNFRAFRGATRDVS